MKKLFLLFCLAGSLVSRAQDILGSNFSLSLNQVTQVKMATNASFPLGVLAQIGASQTWDATGLIENTTVPVINMGNYAPSKSSKGSLYPGASHVRLDTNLMTVVEHQFWTMGADSFAIVGTYQNSGQHEVYTNPMKTLVFPMNLGNNVTDQYAKTNYSDATTISSYQTGQNTITYAGSGTLKLPQATFTGVAMVRGLRTNSIGPNSTEAMWYKISDGTVLMGYKENNGSVTVFYNIAGGTTGIGELAPSVSISILENGSNTPMLRLDQNQEITFELYALDGRLLDKGTLEAGNVFAPEYGNNRGVLLLKAGNSCFKILRGE